MFQTRRPMKSAILRTRSHNSIRSGCREVSRLCKTASPCYLARMPKRIADETGVANFIAPEERLSYRPVPTGRLLNFQPGDTPVAVQEPRKRAQPKNKPTNRIGPPARPTRLPEIQPATDFEGYDTKVLPRPLDTSDRPSLTPSQFSA